MDEYDFQRGQYRRIYESIDLGRRINALSDFAERLFWRIVSKADDFGNYWADPVILGHKAIPLLNRSPDDIQRAISEICSEDERPLAVRYEVKGDRLLHLTDHLALQPPGRNGRRVRRFPPCPFEFERQPAAAPDPTVGPLLQAPVIAPTPLITAAESAGVPDFAANRKALAEMCGQYGDKAVWAAISGVSEARKRKRIANPLGLMRKMLRDGVSGPVSQAAIPVESATAYTERRAKQAQREALAASQAPSPEEHRAWIEQCKRAVKRA